MEKERSIDTLARYIIFVAIAALVAGLCWYFRSVLLYIILAAVVSLIGRPIMKGLKKIAIKGKRLPDSILAALTLVILLVIFVTVVTRFIPIISGIVQSITVNMQYNAWDASPQSFRTFIDNLNYRIVSLFPDVGRDFKIEDNFLPFLKETLSPATAWSISSVSSVLGSLASMLGNITIGLFSVVFISFFFIRDHRLFRTIICAVVPDKYESRAMEAVRDIEHLLSRYFVGLVVEVTGVTTINFIGLSTIAGLNVNNAFAIALITGILNIIPYVGPLTGGIIGTVLGMLLKLSAASAMGMEIHFWTMLAIFVAVFAFTQIVDNFLFQPIIYSTSIKSKPLEIFIALLIAGHIGGILGMLVAIPSYTVIRVIASEFFYNVKAIQRLIPGKKEEDEDKIMELFRDSDIEY